MKAGVSFPAFTQDATFAMVSGAAAAGYPVSSLGDLYNIRTPFLANATGVVAFTFLFSAARAVQFLALLHHNGGAADTMRVRLYSDAALTTQVYDSGIQPIFPPGSAPSSLYPQCFPWLLASPVTARGGRIDLSANAAAWLIGALEVSGFWLWTDVEVPREIGFANTDVVAQQPMNVDHAMSQWAARTFAGTRGSSDQSENATTMIDFQLEKKTSRPFVFCMDLSAASTYARGCMVVRNSKLTPPTQDDYPSGSQAFAFSEHLR